MCRGTVKVKRRMRPMAGADRRGAERSLGGRRHPPAVPRLQHGARLQGPDAVGRRRRRLGRLSTAGAARRQDRRHHPQPHDARRPADPRPFLFFSLLPSFFSLLPSFTGFYRVLPSFTEFYRVLPGFTGFYRFYQPDRVFIELKMVFSGYYVTSPIFTRFFICFPLLREVPFGVNGYC